MQKLSGLILDVYDDFEGDILRKLFSSPDALPEFTKKATSLSASDRGALPDEAFALVMVDGDVELKKFATVDKGNTALSVMYFLKTAHKLPIEAQSVAAENLWAACDQHELQVPEPLQKLALALRQKVAGLGGLINAGLTAATQIPEARKNLAATKNMQGVVLTPNQISQRRSMMGMDE